MIKELIIEGLLRLDSASNVVRIKFYPDAALRTRLFNIDLLHLAKISANKFYLVFYVNIKAWLLLQIYFLGVKHVLEQNTVGRVTLRKRNGFDLFRYLDLFGLQQTQVLISHKFLHKLSAS